NVNVRKGDFDSAIFPDGADANPMGSVRSAQILNNARRVALNSSGEGEGPAFEVYSAIDSEFVGTSPLDYSQFSVDLDEMSRIRGGDNNQRYIIVIEERGIPNGGLALAMFYPTRGGTYPSWEGVEIIPLPVENSNGWEGEIGDVAVAGQGLMQSEGESVFAYVVNPVNQVVYEADFRTGNVREVANASSAVGSEVFETPYGLAVDDDAGTLYVVNNSAGDILQLDIATGDYSLFSSEGNNGITGFNAGGAMTSLILDRKEGRNQLVMLGGINSDLVIGVSLDDGSRSILSQGKAGMTFKNLKSGISQSTGIDKGPAWNEYQEQQYVLVVDSDDEAAYALDLSTGERVVLFKTKVVTP
uniref:YncE family protein n=1 Tax=Teredinibacter waterburyi TaxID=1500538 RepID=UPI001CAA83F6